MKIKQIISQNRRDFRADYECEHCGNIIANMAGYDDSDFHQNVIPKMICTTCGKVADSTYRPLTTKYPDGYII